MRTECQAVGLAEFRLLGDQVLDLSPHGMLVRCTRAARIGDEVLVSFKAPGGDAPWLEAEAIVARWVQGFRAKDRGICAGLDFTYFEKPARNELLARLAGLPPPIPQRRLRTGVERLRSRECMWDWTRELADVIGDTTAAEAVAVHRIVTLRDEPALERVLRRTVPRGVFSA